MNNVCSLPKCGYATFGTQAEAEFYLVNLDGYSGRSYKTEGGKWAVSFRREESNGNAKE